jgi:hypothetical protein
MILIVFFLLVYHRANSIFEEECALGRVSVPIPSSSQRVLIKLLPVQSIAKRLSKTPNVEHAVLVSSAPLQGYLPNALSKQPTKHSGYYLDYPQGTIHHPLSRIEAFIMCCIII